MRSKPQAGRVLIYWLSCVGVQFNQKFIPDIYAATIFSALKWKFDNFLLDFFKPVEWTELRTYRLHEVLDVYVLVINEWGGDLVELLL